MTNLRHIVIKLLFKKLVLIILVIVLSLFFAISSIYLANNENSINCYIVIVFLIDFFTIFILIFYIASKSD